MTRAEMIRQSVHNKIGRGELRQVLEKADWNEDMIEYVINAILNQDA